MKIYVEITLGGRGSTAGMITMFPEIPTAKRRRQHEAGPTYNTLCQHCANVGPAAVIFDKGYPPYCTTVMQSQKAVTAYLKGKQQLLFGTAEY